MSASDEKRPNAAILRSMAEADLANRPVTDSAALPSADLVHELQVYQVELEMQNEALRQKQSELEDSRNRYIDLYDFAPAGYLTLNANGMIEEINLTAATLLGVKRKDLLHRSFTLLVVAEDQSRWMTLFLTVMKRQGKGGVELAMQRGDDAVFQALLNCQTKEIGAGDTAVRIVLTDISERKQLEADLELHRNHLEQLVVARTVDLEATNQSLTVAKRAAEAANIAKSTFLSNISHELRTPLNAVLGFAQLMESGTPVPTPVQQRSLDQIQKAGWHLLELVDEILDLALIESGKATLSQEPVSLAEVIVECRDMLESQAQMRDISMTYPRFVTPCFIHANRTRTKQILINLLSNAIKYNKPSGAVVVECTPLDSQDGIRISVRDTGPGIAPGQLAQLFQPFNRLGREAGTEQGTGIGLLVTKKLVELMGGTIGVESVPGVGSTFWVDLIRASVPQQLVPVSANPVLIQPPLPPAGPQQRTVLYVEDNPSNLDLVEQLIARRPGLKLLSATDVNGGILLARSHLPAAILMDINLPGISGLDAMSILRADPATRHIPIIAVSANAVPRDIERGLGAGFFAYVTKPIKVSAFMAALDAALESSMGASVKET
ncbi:MAG: response regulator [Rhodocyclaceae bacterium]|nr:MAG: response regulator [Rhodocyclaceae bacterium]